MNLANGRLLVEGDRFLLPHHLDEMRASGLSDETLVAAGVYSEEADQPLRLLLNHKPRSAGIRGPAIIFPHFDSDGAARFWRAKLDRSRVIGDRVLKYEQPRGEHPRPYIPPEVWATIGNGCPLFFTEGEKKALAGTQAGFPTISIPGVYGWKARGREAFTPEIEAIGWEGREITAVFDSDIEDNPAVLDALARFCKMAADRKASPKVIFLPAGEDGAKQGLDDFLLARGATAFGALVREAGEPPLIDPVLLLGEAREIDAEREAQRIADADPGRWKVWRGELYALEGDRFVEWDRVEQRLLIRRSLAMRFTHLSTNHVANVQQALEALVRIPTKDAPFWSAERPADWDPATWIVAQNGTAPIDDLKAIVPLSSGLFRLNVLPFDIDAKAKLPLRWLGFLSECFLGDADSELLLQQFAGLLLTADTRFQKMLALVGPPRSGKGITLAILTRLLGAASVSVGSLARLGRQFGIQSLIGKSLAAFPDIRLGRQADKIQVLETLLTISGEDSVTVDRKNLTDWNGKLGCRFLFMSNEVPELEDASGALMARLLLLEYRQSFLGREDRGLLDALTEELPGILLWAIEGLESLREAGRFVEPEASSDLIAQAEEQMSPIKTFVADCCEIHHLRWVSTKDLNSAYQAWRLSNEMGQSDPVELGKGLASAYREKVRKKRRLDNTGKYFPLYEGIRLR